MYGIGLRVELRSAHARDLIPGSEVEGDDSLVVVAVEGVIYLKRWRRRWRKLVNVCCECRIASRPRERAWRASVTVDAHRRCASISPKAELKVHAFLNASLTRL